MAETKDSKATADAAKDAPKDDPAQAAAAVEQTREDMQAATDQAAAQGFVGTKVDPTPDEHYTLGGVVEGKPTPETSPEMAAKAHVAARFPGIAPEKK